MSKPLTKKDILFRQRLLSCSGYYTGKLDGIWGKKTEAADRQFETASDAIALALGKFEARSEGNIRSLRPDVQKLARMSLKAIIAAGFAAKIISGTRTYKEQDDLYKKGRGKKPKGKIVTKAKGGESWHNFGLAWDIGLFADGAYVTSNKEYIKAAKHGKVKGVAWGGDWKKFTDNPHYYCASASSKTSLRRAFERGCR